MGLAVLLFFLILFSSSSSSSAVPISRTAAIIEDRPSLVSFRSPQGNGVMKLEGRMDIEVADYPGTGANNNHDPRSPGTTTRQ